MHFNFVFNKQIKNYSNLLKIIVLNKVITYNSYKLFKLAIIANVLLDKNKNLKNKTPYFRLMFLM